MYNKSKLGSAKAQLRIVSQSYGDMVRTFLFQVGAARGDLDAGTLIEAVVSISFAADLQQRRVPAVLELQAGLQPALQEARLKAEQAADIFTQVNNDKILSPSFPQCLLLRRMSMSGHGSPMTGSQMTSSAMSIGP